MKKCFLVLICLIVLGGCSFSEDISPQEQIMYDAIDETEKNSKDSDVYTAQKENVEDIKKNYEKENYTIDNPYVVVNPYLYNNLAAYVIFDIDKDITYSYSVKSKEDSKTPDFTYTNDEKQSDTVVIPVVALYENYNNEVTIAIDDGESTIEKVVEIQTEASPDNYEPVYVSDEELNSNASEADEQAYEKADVDNVIIDTTVYDEEVLKYFNNGFLLLDTYDVYDLDGNLRFSSPTSTLGEGGLKIQGGKFVVFNQKRSRGYLADVTGKIYAELKLPKVNIEGLEEVEFHHDVVITPDDKSIYALAGFRELEEGTVPLDIEGTFIEESFIFKYDITGGYPVKVFDVGKYFSNSETNDVDGNLQLDPVHMNSIDYYEEKNELIISSKRQSMIFALEADNGNLEWMYKQEEQVSEENKDKLLEITNPDEFKYSSGNHTAFVMRTDKYMTNKNELYLSVFNNNNCLESENTLNFTSQEDSGVCNWKEYSAMEIYKVDVDKKTITFEEEIIPDDSRWSYIMSSVFTNHDGIYEVNYTLDGLDNGQQLYQPSLLVTDEAGNIELEVQYYGLGMVYRSRVITEDEIYSSLSSNLNSIKK